VVEEAVVEEAAEEEALVEGAAEELRPTLLYTPARRTAAAHPHFLFQSESSPPP
jgi:hypothetical protein